jgi:hypothetical protein
MRPTICPTKDWISHPSTSRLTCTNVPRVAANDVEESFREFGRRRGLFDAGGHSVEALTPLLTRAEGTALRPAVRGPLAGGGEALLGRLRGGVRHAAGAESDAHSESLVAITRVPESEPIVSRLFCWRRGRVEAISGMGFELDHEVVRTESIAFTERYEITAGPYEDPDWIRQLFAADFIQWLLQQPPPSFSFELAYGDLVGATEVAEPGPDDLAALWDTTEAVAERIRVACREYQ